MEMTVGAAAEAAGVSAKAVRLWESKGLLPPAPRTDAGYRVFTQDDVDVLRFIRQAKALDLTLGEIKDILDLQRCGTTPCGRVTTLLDAHIAEIDRKLSDLRDAPDPGRGPPRRPGQPTPRRGRRHLPHHRNRRHRLTPNPRSGGVRRDDSPCDHAAAIARHCSAHRRHACAHN